MTEIRKVGTLEIQEDPEFQRREWPALRIGRLLIALVIICGAVGVLGAGPVASAVVSTADGRISLSYDRIVRHDDDTRLEVHIDSAADTITIWFTRDYLAGVELRNIIPEPVSSTVAGDRVWFEFATHGPTTIFLRFRPDDIGRRSAKLGLERGREVSFRQFVLP